MAEPVHNVSMEGVVGQLYVAGYRRRLVYRFSKQCWEKLFLYFLLSSRVLCVETILISIDPASTVLFAYALPNRIRVCVNAEAIQNLAGRNFNKSEWLTCTHVSIMIYCISVLVFQRFSWYERARDPNDDRPRSFHSELQSSGFAEEVSPTKVPQHIVIYKIISFGEPVET